MRTLQDNHEGHVALLCCHFYSHVETWGVPTEKVPTYNTSLPTGTATEGIAGLGAKMAAVAGGAVPEKQSLERPAITEVEKEDESRPELSRFVIVIYLAGIVILTTFCTNFAVDSIDNLSQEANISKSFIGLISLPILNNDTTPIHYAVKDNMHRTMNFTIGKCSQTALFVTPLMILIT